MAPVGLHVGVKPEHDIQVLQRVLLLDPPARFRPAGEHDHQNLWRACEAASNQPRDLTN